MGHKEGAGKKKDAEVSRELLSQKLGPWTIGEKVKKGLNERSTG